MDSVTKIQEHTMYPPQDGPRRRLVLTDNTSTELKLYYMRYSVKLVVGGSKESENIVSFEVYSKLPRSIQSNY